MARMRIRNPASVITALAHLFLETRATFTPTFSTTSTQCGAFTISWSSNTTANAVPPFSLLLIPVNDANSPAIDTPGRGGESLSQPVYVPGIPGSAWNTATEKGSYTIDQLPLRAGEKFVVAMDDAFGLGTGGVSTIQTVGGDASSPTSCLGNVQHSDVLFQLSTYAPPQCGPMTIVSGQASTIRGFVPGGNAVSLELPASSTGNMTTRWTVNIPSGTSIVLLYIGIGGERASSGLMASNSDSAFGAGCLIASGPHSTTTTIPSSSPSPISPGGSPTGSISTPALVGGIIGALAFLAIAALLIFFCIVRRTDAMGRPKSRSENSGSRGGGAGRSTVEPYKSYDLAGSLDAGAGGSGSGGSGGAGRAGYGRLGSNASGRKAGASPGPGANGGAATLEARFGGGLFGRKKKGDGANAPSNPNNTFTSSQRRAMYPGLSIASTQNQSVGTVGTIPAPGAGEDGFREVERSRGQSREDPLDRPPGESAIMTRYRDAKRREMREHHSRGDSDVSVGSATMNSVPPVHEERLAGPGRHARDLSAIDEGTSYGSGTIGTEPPASSRHYSLVHSDSFHDSSSGAMLLADLSGNEKFSSPDPSTRQNGRRPSTAPGAPFHLPTSARDGLTTTTTGGSLSPPLQVHEYPPDQKASPVDEWDSTDALDWRATSEVARTGIGGVGRGRHHPYATAQSPHEEVDRYSPPFGRPGAAATVTTMPSNSSRGGGGQRIGGGGRGSRRVPHPYSDPSIHSPTEIIRHTDAGPMMDSGDEDEDEVDGRRVIELPPSYVEVASSNRGRRRGGGG